MMTGRERKVILYSADHNTAPCDEHVVVVTDEQQERWFGEHDLGSLERGGFDWDPASPWWTAMNHRAIAEITSRADKEDLLCLIAGRAQQAIADALPANIVAEFGVGYEGIIFDRHPSPAFAAFESHSHRHLVYGLNRWQNTPRQYDTVIPNFFDPDELPEGPGGDYLLFVGRMIRLKAPQTVASIGEALGMRVVIAGPGATAWSNTNRAERRAGRKGFVEFPEGRVEGSTVEYVGPVGVEERGVLMGGAAVTVVPTIYVEPFGGVAVESMTTGTPVVTTDFGAFTETVAEGVSGYRFQTLQEAVDGTVRAMELDRSLVRRYALERYSLDAVRPMYERWFTNLDGLWGEGWTALRDAPPARATMPA